MKLVFALLANQWQVLPYQGKGGASNVGQPQVSFRLIVHPPMPPDHPHPPYPRSPIIYDGRRPPCPPFDLPLWPTIEIVEPSAVDEVTKNLIKQCQVECWVGLDRLRFSCKVIRDDMVEKWYADCIKQCYESNGKHIEIALWQGVE